MDSRKKIFSTLNKSQNVLIVGKTDSGKTYFVKNSLIPYLKSRGINIVYFSNCGKIKRTHNKQVAVIDEVETLKDLDYLTKGNKKPYYTKKYTQKVKGWFKKLKLIKPPAIYILTRNKDKEINNIKQNVKFLDWNRQKFQTIVYKRKHK